MQLRRLHVENLRAFDRLDWEPGPGINLLTEVIETKNILFGSEMVGAVRGIDPQTGHYFDDTRRYIDSLNVSSEAKRQIFELNARRVYPRLDALLKARGQ